MASALTLGYPQGPPAAGIAPSKDVYMPTTQFPPYLPSVDGKDLSGYDAMVMESAAVLAAQTVSEHWRRPPPKPASQTSRPVSQKSSSRAEVLQAPFATTDSSRPPHSRTTAGKDRFKLNLKKIAQQKEDDPTAFDLSKTAEENERRTGIGIYTQRPVSRSTTDVRWAPLLPPPRNHTFASSTEYASYKPSAAFMNSPWDASRPGTSSSSIGGEVYSLDYGNSRRPSLAVTTSPKQGSFGSTRPRRSTNQSMASSGGATPKGRKSFDKAFSLLAKKESNPTDDIMDEVARTASIQAARLAFDKRQEEKDAKYEKRAAKLRERQERKEMRRSVSDEPRYSVYKDSSTIKGPDYAALSMPPQSTRPDMGTRMMSDRGKTSRSRGKKSQYALFSSWLKTKLLSLEMKR